MNEVELKVLHISSTINPIHAYALVLEEVDGAQRKLPVIIGETEAQGIKASMRSGKFPRPMTHDLFPALTKMLGVTLSKVEIYKIKDGIYYSYLYFEKDGEVYQIDSRTSDAVSLALCYSRPIYISEELLEKEHLRELGKGAFSVPVNSINVEMLRDALNKAVEKENYELASRLRDEIKRREEENK